MDLSCISFVGNGAQALISVLNNPHMPTGSLRKKQGYRKDHMGLIHSVVPVQVSPQFQQSSSENENRQRNSKQISNKYHKQWKCGEKIVKRVFPLLL